MPEVMSAEQKVRGRSQGDSTVDTFMPWLTGIYDNLTLQTEVIADHIAVLGTLNVKAPILRGVIYVVKGVTEVIIDKGVREQFGPVVHFVSLTWEEMASRLAPPTGGVVINMGDGAVATDGGIAVGKGGIIIRGRRNGS
jgi:hypothetical protein